LVFPEWLLGGYARGLLRYGDRRPERVGPGRAEYLAYSPEAVTIPGPQIDQLATIAAARGRRSDPGIRNHAHYCASVTIDDAGAVVGKAEDLPTPLPSNA
jgi:hypothetical protein